MINIINNNHLHNVGVCALEPRVCVLKNLGQKGQKDKGQTDLHPSQYLGICISYIYFSIKSNL